MSSNEYPPSESGSPRIGKKPPPQSSQVAQAPLESVSATNNQPIEPFEAAPPSVVHNVPTPSVLTADILAITDKAVSNYYSVRAEHIHALSKSESNASPGLFSSSSTEDLIRYFSAAVDAEHAIRLRESALLADIGDCVELLASKLKLYDQDREVSKRASKEVELIRTESEVRNLDINFYGLEYYRSVNNSGESFMEEHRERVDFWQTLWLSEIIGSFGESHEFVFKQRRVHNKIQLTLDAKYISTAVLRYGPDGS
ncbi:hypothetical protein HYPSUDRAFT_206291 [Hypholoma sublateritium FD-334 SS-4]|uniref:Uncharacterized protein n=1 Tax=Hypholoma sublateritium (strain FD-334 SS-4) TaxID=945553 RepID=A0A0D2NE68_HYPSF|nr:hypothetical protein HYPSUDRAFT_206291 [Hypholoma sublateritium FD-334 SS-4]